MTRKLVFNAGPAALPEEVLVRAKDELLELGQEGMSVLEISHRSKAFEAIIDAATERMRSLLLIPDDYDVLFLQGGASSQFFQVPMNLCPPGKVACYVETGSWSKKAVAEAKLLGETAVVASTADTKFSRIPRLEEIKVPAKAAYLHLTSNNTIYGTQWQTFPDTGDVPLVADMSSDILSRPIDVSRFGLIYAGAQKNLGPAGVTVVIIRRDLAQRAPANLPTMVRYTTHMEKKSLYNTPPVFAIYMVGLVLEWLENRKGGMAGMAKENEAKAQRLYGVIDKHSAYYRTPVEPDSRSRMNVVFTLATPEMEADFIAKAAKAGFLGLKGHRSVGGMRASIYNAIPLEGVERLASFMEEMAK